MYPRLFAYGLRNPMPTEWLLPGAARPVAACVSGRMRCRTYSRPVTHLPLVATKHKILSRRVATQTSALHLDTVGRSPPRDADASAVNVGPKKGPGALDLPFTARCVKLLVGRKIHHGKPCPTGRFTAGIGHDWESLPIQAVSSASMNSRSKMCDQKSVRSATNGHSGT